MGIKLSLDPAIYKWQAKYNQKMTYAELAKRAGISEPTIYRLTSGQPTKLDLGKLNRICKVLECQPGDLLERVPTREEDNKTGFFESLDLIKWRMQDRADTMKVIQENWSGAETTKVGGNGGKDTPGGGNDISH